MGTYLGIDLGTSSVKLLLAGPQGVLCRSRCSYKSPDPAGWKSALTRAATQLKQNASFEALEGIALSSQVGTYLTDTGTVLNWESNVGSLQLQQLRKISPEQWVQEIGMVHPELTSYPLPRLMYLKETDPRCRSVEMPKEMLLQELTGNTATDIFSWRGLCHPKKGCYSQRLLEAFDISFTLPILKQPTDLAGFITAEAAARFGLPEGTKVYIGCNDFYAGLLGMGVWKEGCLFELSGTSEHLGCITKDRTDGKLISGEYFEGYATYGGTKASGNACMLAQELFDVTKLKTPSAYQKAPVFLPYLKGERAPVYDEDAKGVFFGLTHKTTREEMAYAALEGVVFSLYHIGCSLPLPPKTPLISGGGSSGNLLMAQLKAAIFDRPVLQAKDSDASALGAAILAMVGNGAFPKLSQAVNTLVQHRTLAMPDKALQKLLLRRFEIYRGLYPRLKQSFKDFGGENL